MAADGKTGSAISWKLPLIAAVAVLCTAGPILWSRDFGFFVLRAPYSIGLGAVCLGLLLSGFLARMPGVRPTLVASAISAVVMFASLYLAATPATIDFVHDRLGFWLWYATHGDVVRQYAKRDAIITTWDSWGFAGMENDSFLVSDPDDSIGTSTASAARWTKRLKSACSDGVAGAVRLKRGVYILTTYNCPLTDERKHSG